MRGQNHCRVMKVSSYRVVRIQIHGARRIYWPWYPFLPSWEGGLGHCSLPEQSVEQIIGLSSGRVFGARREIPAHARLEGRNGVCAGGERGKYGQGK